MALSFRDESGATPPTDAAKLLGVNEPGPRASLVTVTAAETAPFKEWAQLLDREPAPSDGGGCRKPALSPRHAKVGAGAVTETVTGWLGRLGYDQPVE